MIIAGFPKLTYIYILSQDYRVPAAVGPVSIQMTLSVGLCAVLGAFSTMVLMVIMVMFLSTQV